MNDQELLTYAAKAAGIEINFESEIHGYYAREYDDNGDVSEWWNPLIDNADAFQLMCKLKIDLYFGKGDVETSVTPKKGYFEEVFLEFWNDEQSKMTAARKVIVMAAAEIGKGM